MWSVLFGLYSKILGPQMVVLFLEIVETLGGGISQKEVGQ